MKKSKFLVLGAGLVGAEIARCLSKEGKVTVVDRNAKALALLMAQAERNSKLELIGDDFFNTRYMLDLARSHDVVVGAIEPSIAYRVLTQVAEAGRPIVDISFYEESPLALDPVAQICGIPIVVDCGVAPGLSNMLLGGEMAKMRVEIFVCQCGGLPEYPKLGRLVGINSDGLRTLLQTTDVPNMVDQSLRYPAHMRLIQDFIESGFLSEEPVSVKSCDGEYVNVVPRVFSERIFADAWKLDADEDEFTVFIVRMEGMSGGKRTCVTYHTLEGRDPVTYATSMSRMTGYPCAAVALLLAKGDITKAGVTTPEEIGRDEKLMQFVLNFMEERGISLKKEVQRGPMEEM